uniref:Uncharacterized protein n=1 Tax=Tanacetum cinerariifolium TaxID=118510 RepID=A0A6L2NL50_TANCI|nr:hypothetical protein [Tanacetum cinerariifolium]
MPVIPSVSREATFPDVVTFQFPYKSDSVATFPDVVTFQFPYNCESVQVPVVVTAEEVGAKAIDNNILTNLLPPGYNNIVCMTEVVLDYSCPFCYLACASYKEDEKYKVVNVSYNKIDAFSPQIFGILAGEEKKMFFCHKALPRTKIDEDQTQLAHHLGHVPMLQVPAVELSDTANYLRSFMGQLWKRSY